MGVGEKMNCPCHPLFDKHNKVNPDMIAYTTEQHIRHPVHHQLVCLHCTSGLHTPGDPGPAELVLELEKDGKLHGFTHVCKDHKDHATNYYKSRGIAVINTLEVEVVA